MAFRATGIVHGETAILSWRYASDVRSPDGHLLFQCVVFSKLGLQLLHDFTDGHSVVFEPIAWFEGAHHMSHGEGVDRGLRLS